MTANVEFKIDAFKHKNKIVKVYGKGENAYILYKGDHIPFKKLVKKDDGYFINIFLYYYLEEDEYNEHFGIC